MKTTDGIDFEDIDRIYNGWESNFTLSISPRSLGVAFFSWALHMAALPGKRTELSMEMLSKISRYFDYLRYAVENGDSPHSFTPASDDSRFSGPEWKKWPFNALAQGFLMMESCWQSATTRIHGLSCHHENVVSFTIRQFLDIFAPSNFIATNPEVLKRTQEQSGTNLVRGWLNFQEDLKRALNREKPAGADAFRVGENIAVTPGKVIFRNRLIELIQYSPATGQVYAEPLLIVPAWIMKYYILDLSPHNSLARHLVEKGYTVFMISWKNPDSEDRDISMDDYRTLGVMAALDVISAVVPGKKVHTLGYCIGGNILSITAAAMARDDDDRIASLTLLTTQSDFSEAGELMLFIDECQVTYLEDIMWIKGYLDTRQMSGAFQLLRSNYLIWSRYIQDYLMGERRPMTDLMAWNADTTRMPYRMHSEFLRSLFLDNDLAEEHYIAGDSPVFLNDIKGPIFLVATLRDHVAPWRSVYKFLFQNNAEEITFVLCSGGHNAGIVSEPGGNNRSFFRMSTRKAGEKHLDPDSWVENTPEQTGSWWTPWERWLAEHSSSLAAPPAMGAPEKGLGPLGDAPGTYVYLD